MTLALPDIFSSGGLGVRVMSIINVVVDISHHNGQIDFAQAKASGIVGVIQKATQGQSGVDRTYDANRKAALQAGLLWGAYHFATGSDGIKQADNFLKVAAPDTDTLLVLDFEPNPTGPSMDLVEAHAFVSHVQQATGKHPGFYSAHLTRLGEQNPLEDLATTSNCGFLKN